MLKYKLPYFFDFLMFNLGKIVNDTNNFTEMVNEKTNGGVEIMENTDFTQTLLSQFEDISAQVRQHETFTDRWGYECARYYAVDVQENEVIVVDAKNNYNYFGLSFTMNGDKAEINFESAKRKKLRYEDYEEGSSIEGAFDFGKHIEEIENNAFAKVEDANAKTSEAEGKVAEVYGVEGLTGNTVKATDLRAGAAMVIAGLIAKGETVIEDIHHIQRGYEKIVEKLSNVGADIKIINE